MSQRATPRVNASVILSVLIGGRTIITRVFAYGKSQVKVSSQAETQQAGCKSLKVSLACRMHIFHVCKFVYRIHDLHSEM